MLINNILSLESKLFLIILIILPDTSAALFTLSIFKTRFQILVSILIDSIVHIQLIFEHTHTHTHTQTYTIKG